MRRLVVALIATSLIQFGMKSADACGDKTMRVRGGLRYYQTQAAKRPSTILIYSAALPPGDAVELSKHLNKVGHKATSVDDVASIKNNLRSSHYDLVLTNLAEAPQLQKQVESFTPKTAVVPVLSSKADEKTAALQYKVTVNNPKRLEDFLIAVVRVMNSQSKKS